MRLALVANEASGAGGAGEVAACLERHGARVHEVPLDRFCDGPEAVDDARLDAVAAELGADRLVVAGGDGSIGPAAALAERAGVPLAVIPAGTANDFVRALGLPLDVEEACALAADPDAGVRRAELASADGRPFVNAASTGLSVLAAERARDLKSRLGKLAYAIGAARAAAAGRPLHVRVRTDREEAWEGKAWQVVVAATGAFGGGSSTGGVDRHDDELDVAVVEAGPRIALARRALAMKRGRLVHDDEVRHLRGERIDVELDGVQPRFNVDGEVLTLDPARFAVIGSFEVVTG